MYLDLSGLCMSIERTNDNVNRKPVLAVVAEKWFCMNDSTWNASKHAVNLSDGQETVDYIAEYLDVGFKVVRNTLSSSVQEICLINTGTAVIRGGNWVIYFNHLYLMLISVGGIPAKGVLIEDSGFRLFHVKGSLHSITPNGSNFRPIYPGERRLMRLDDNYHQVAKTDSFPNWYVTAPDLKAKVMHSTAEESLDFVANFNESAQWKLSPLDAHKPYTARERFVMHERMSRDLNGPGLPVIPTPEDADLDYSKTLVITPKDWVIVSSTEFVSEAKFLADRCLIHFSYNFPKRRYIYLTKRPSNMNFTMEEYLLMAEPATEVVQIFAEGQAGAFYGVQTILSLLQRDGERWIIPKTNIRDKPRFPYRGIQVDVSRNFHPKETIMKLLDAMGTYKLNKLHFHLSDDDGWRLEIPGMEELTQIGAKRCHDVTGKECLLPQHGSGPYNTTSGSGFYTIDHYKEILVYAQKRHIQVIPEFDVPGHARAAVKAMEVRFHRFNRLDPEGAEEFLLTEWDDKSRYRTAQSYNDGVVNVCLQSTFNFLQHVFSAVKEMHQQIQPLDTVHIGGDEIAEGAWKHSPACETLKKTLNMTDLKFYFVKRLIHMLDERNLAAGVWEDGIIPRDIYAYKLASLKPDHDKSDATCGNTTCQNRDILAYAWNNIWQFGRASRAITLANSGYKVVMAQATHLYFDHPYEPDPEERGLYWATRYINTRKVFGFIPMHLMMNADVDILGESLENAPAQTFGCQNKDTCVLTSPQNIIGLEANIWTETIRSRDQLESMAFPRVLALAERAWHKAPWEDILEKNERTTKLEADWIKFSNSLGYKELRRLDTMGIKYRIPPPGAIIEKNVLQVNLLYPNMVVQYSLDSGKTWVGIPTTQSAVKNTDTSRTVNVYTNRDVLVRTLSANRRRHSRVVRVSLVDV